MIIPFLDCYPGQANRDVAFPSAGPSTDSAWQSEEAERGMVAIFSQPTPPRPPAYMGEVSTPPSNVDCLRCHSFARFDTILIHSHLLQYRDLHLVYPTMLRIPMCRNCIPACHAGHGSFRCMAGLLLLFRLTDVDIEVAADWLVKKLINR